MIYIGCPYTHPDKSVMRDRYLKVTQYTAQCMLRKEIVYSPITSGHEMARLNKLPTDWEFWRHFDLDFLSRSCELRVFMLSGWESSRGLIEEIRCARESLIPITYVEHQWPSCNQ